MQRINRLSIRIPPPTTDKTVSKHALVLPTTSSSPQALVIRTPSAAPFSHPRPTSSPSRAPPDHINVQARLLLPAAAEEVPAGEPGQVGAELVADVGALGDGEDEVQVLERATLGLLHQGEDEGQGDEVEAREEGEGAAVVEVGDDAFVLVFG